MDIPEWVTNVAQAIAQSTSFDNPSGLDQSVAEPDADEPFWILRIAPEKLEVVGTVHDGSLVAFPPTYNILEAMRLFDMVEVVEYVGGRPDAPEFVGIKGKVGHQSLLLMLFPVPFAEAEVRNVVDLTAKGGYRPKGSQQE